MAKSLKKQVTTGISWRAGVDIGEQILQIVFTAILARLLTKADFGLVATALIVNRFFQTITNVGFGGAIIRSPDVTKGQISAVFYIQLALNVVLTLVVFFLARPIAMFFNEIELVGLIEVTAWVILLQTFQFPTILMQKNMDFKNFSIMEISSLLMSNLVAIGMALSGFGLWSLVFRLIIQRILFSASTWYFTKWRPTKPDFKGIKPLMTFGFNALGSNIVYYFSENMIAIITSKFLGKEVMGLYNIAYNLAIVPASKIKNVLTKVLTPGFAKIQTDLKSFTRNNQKALLYTSLLFIPFMFVLSGISENLILTMYGEKWREAGNLLMILAFAGLSKGMVNFLQSSILSKGQANIIFYSIIAESAISIPIMYLMVFDYGIYGLITGYMIGAIARVLLIITFYNRLFGEKKFFYKTVTKPLLIGSFIFLSLISLNQINLSPMVELGIQLGTATFLFLISMKLLYNSISQELLLKFKIKKPSTVN